MKKYKTAANFVRPLPPAQKEEPLELVGWGGLVSSDSIHVGQPLSVQHGAHEQTSGMDRSLAWGVRLIPYTLIILILALTLVRLTGGGWLLGFCLFAGLSLGAYVVLDKREHMYSRNGVERHKVDTLAGLKYHEMDNEQEIKLLALQGQIEMWRAQRGLTGTGQAIGGRGRALGDGIGEASPHYPPLVGSSTASED